MYEKRCSAESLADVLALAAGAHPLTLDGVGRFQGTRGAVVAQAQVPAGQRHVQMRHLRLADTRRGHLAPTGDGSPFAHHQVGACLLQADGLCSHWRCEIGNGLAAINLTFDF